MDLKDLKPKSSKLYLSSMGKEYTLRPWTLDDQIWMNQEYGAKITEIFNEKTIDIVAISRMAYRLLEDKSDFVAVPFKEINEEGIEVEGLLGGYKLLVKKISSLDEQLKLLAAVVESIGVSMPENTFDLNAAQEKKS